MRRSPSTRNSHPIHTLLIGESEIFRAALAILALLEPVLMLAGFEEALQLLQHLPFGNLPLDSAPCDSAPTASGLPNDGASANDAADDAVVADGAHAPEGCVLGGGVGAGMVRGIVHARASPPRQTPRSREVLQDVLATRLAEAALLEAVRGRRRLRPLRALLTRAHRL